MNDDDKELESKVKDFVELNLKNIFKNRINTIRKYLIDYNITLEQAIQEVNDKQSKLSNSCRETLIMLKPTVLDKWIYNKDETDAKD